MITEITVKVSRSKEQHRYLSTVSQPGLTIVTKMLAFANSHVHDVEHLKLRNESAGIACGTRIANLTLQRSLSPLHSPAVLQSEALRTFVQERLFSLSEIPSTGEGSGDCGNCALPCSQLSPASRGYKARPRLFRWPSRLNKWLRNRHQRTSIFGQLGYTMSPTATP